MIEPARRSGILTYEFQFSKLMIRIVAKLFSCVISILAFGVLVGCAQDDSEPAEAWNVKVVGPQWPLLLDEPVGPDGYFLEYPKSVTASAVAGKHLWVQGESRLYHSTDSGHYWQTLRVPDNSKVIEIEEYEGRLMAITSDGLLIESADLGKSWQTRDLVNDFTALTQSSDEGLVDITISHAVISNNHQTITVVRNCHVIQSTDRGLTWRKIEYLAKTPGAGSQSYCIDSVQLNQQSDLEFAKMTLHASVYHGDYAMRLIEGKWRSLCTYDYSLAAIEESIRHCDDLKIDGANHLIKPNPELWRWLRQGQEEDLIFAHSSHVIPYSSVNASKERKGFADFIGLIQGELEGEYWYIDHQGVSHTKDAGETWSTLIGGAGELTDVTQVVGDFWIAASREGLARSQDGGRTWVEWERMNWVRGIVRTPDSVFVKSDMLYRISLSNLENPDFWKLSLGSYFEFPGNFYYTPNALWVIGDELAKASADGGATWRTHSVPEGAIAWRCIDTCLAVKRTGEVIEMTLENGRVSTNEVSKVGRSVAAEVNAVWSSGDGAVWVVETTRKNQGSDYWVSINSAKSWSLLPISDRNIRSVVFHNQGLVTLVAQEDLFTVTGPTSLTHRRLPTDSYANKACRLSSGNVIVPSIERTHPSIQDPLQFAALEFDVPSEDWVAKRTEHIFCHR